MKPVSPDQLTGLPVAFAPLPLATPRCVVLADGQTLFQIVETAIREYGLPPAFRQHGVVCINDEPYYPGVWHLVRPKVGSAARPIVVSLALSLGRGSGGSGQKNPVATLAMIAVLIAATVVSAGALGPLTGLGFLGAGTIGAKIAGAALLVGGALAVGSLSATPTLPAGPDAAATDAAGRSASLSGNVLVPGNTPPRVIGTRRVFPVALCEPLIEVVGEDEVAEIVYGLAGPHALSELRAGNASAADIPELQYELQEGWPDSPRQSLVTRYGHTEQPGLELSRHQVQPGNGQKLLNQGSPAASIPHWHAFASRAACDEVWITLQWMEGLFWNVTPGRIKQPIRIRFRLRGASTWINGPEIHFSANKPVPFSKMIRLHWGATPTLPLPPTDGGPIYAYKSVPGQSAVWPVTSGWTADAYFSAGAGDDYLASATAATSKVRHVGLYPDKAVLYLDEAAFPKGVYEIELIAGRPYPDNLSAAAYTMGGVVYDLFGYFQHGSTVSGGALSTPGDYNSVSDDLTAFHWRITPSRVSSVRNTNPVQSTKLATVAAKVHGRAIDQVSVLASGYVQDWDGTGWRDWTTTSNPAAHYRDVLGGRLNADPIPQDLIGDATLAEWRQHCIDNDYTVDAVIDGRSAQAVLNMIAACGYARPRQSEIFDVMVDKDRSAESIVQLFSARNMRGFRFERALAPRPSGLRVRFDRADADYVEDQIVVNDPRNSAPAAVRLEEVRYEGFVDEEKAVARAEFDQKQADLRFIFYYGEALAEGLRARRGDVVGVQHDVLSHRAGYGRVKSVTTSGSNVTGLVLDGSIPVPTSGFFTGDDGEDFFVETGGEEFFVDEATGVLIRLRDGTTMVKEVTAASEEAKTITFATPFAIPGGGILAPDCHLVSGELGSETSRMIVFRAIPARDYNVALTFVPEAPELHAA